MSESSLVEARIAPAQTIRAGIAILTVSLLCACGEPSLVDDSAGLFEPAQNDRLAEYHAYLLLDHDIDYRVVTTREPIDINGYAVAKFAALEVGERSSAGRGLLLVIDVSGDVVRLEVGYALEGVFPDAFVAYVEARQMVPFFAAERVADGILAATELIVDRVQKAKAGGAYDGEVWLAGSGGGGASVQAAIGAAVKSVWPAPAHRASAGRSPQQTLAFYFAAMDERNADPELPIYTAATRHMLRDWVVTPAQMDNLLKTYRHCGVPEERRDADGERAVIRYPIDDRLCAPFFFRRDGTDWQLDLSLMGSAIRFGRDNSWRFHDGVVPAYAFAFTDWTFDGHGFPRARR